MHIRQGRISLYLLWAAYAMLGCSVASSVLHFTIEHTNEFNDPAISEMPMLMVALSSLVVMFLLLFASVILRRRKSD